jgi:hypothetical protein
MYGHYIDIETNKTLQNVIDISDNIKYNSICFNNNIIKRTPQMYNEENDKYYLHKENYYLYEEGDYYDDEIKKLNNNTKNKNYFNSPFITICFYVYSLFLPHK